MGAGRAARWGTLLAATVVVAGCGATGPRPRVLGVSLVATTTTAPAAPVVAPPVVRPAAPPATEAPAPVTSSSTRVPSPPVVTPPPRSENEVAAPTTTAPPAPGESRAPGTYFEPTDLANSYHVAPDGTTRASAIQAPRRDAPERADVTVMYFGASVEVQLTNLTERTVLLPDGYRADVECRRDGQPWRTAEAANAPVVSVDPGGTVSALVDVPADGPGTYDCTATVEIVLPG